MTILDVVQVNVSESWRAEAACYGWDHNIFFPQRGEAKKVKLAKSICKDCLVKQECLEFAVSNEIVDGIWGGLSGREMRKHKRKLKLTTSIEGN